MSCGRKDPDSSDVCGVTYTCGACIKQTGLAERVERLEAVVRLLAFYVRRKVLTDPEAIAELKDTMGDLGD